jgi:tripartite-type tricarboxylate transporter receptor subunit TctC
MSAWYGLGAPKNTPAEIVDSLYKEINAGLPDPGMTARLAALGSSAVAVSPSNFGRFIADEIEKWGKVRNVADTPLCRASGLQGHARKTHQQAP